MIEVIVKGEEAAFQLIDEDLSNFTADLINRNNQKMFGNLIKKKLNSKKQRRRIGRMIRRSKR